MLRPPTRGSVRRIAALLTALSFSLVACSGDGGDAAASGGLVGNLCSELPQPGEMGGPDALIEMPTDEALTWMPVLTNFEAGSRAAEMSAELNGYEAITILAPVDDAFTRAMTRSTLDELLLVRQDEMKTLLDSHIIEGRFSMRELQDMEEVTTVAGTTINIAAPREDSVQFDDKAQTICAGWETQNATIHIIDDVLGEEPTPSTNTDPDH